MQEQRAAGQNIDSFCGKCKVGQDHTIMAMEGGKVTKVRCKHCGSSHKFRDPAAAQKVRKPKADNGAAEAATAEIVWAAGLAGAKGSECEYSMALTYRVGDIVNHRTFGRGVVVKLHVNKCEMLFKDRERLMASTNE